MLSEPEHALMLPSVLAQLRGNRDAQVLLLSQDLSVARRFNSAGERSSLPSPELDCAPGSSPCAGLPRQQGRTRRAHTEAWPAMPFRPSSPLCARRPAPERMGRGLLLAAECDLSADEVLPADLLPAHSPYEREQMPAYIAEWFTGAPLRAACTRAYRALPRLACPQPHWLLVDRA